MKKRIFIFAMMLGTAVSSAQTNRFPPINLYNGDPTGNACTMNSPLLQSQTTGYLYTCNPNTLKYQAPGNSVNGNPIAPSSVTTPLITFPQGSGNSPWTIKVNQGLFDINEIVFSAAQNPMSYDDLAYVLQNTAPVYVNNCSSYSATGGVVTFTCTSGQNPSNATTPPCVQFAGYSGSLSALNNPAGDSLPSCSGVAFRSTYIGPTQFSIATTLVTGSGTDNTGSANFWPIAEDFASTDSFGGGGDIAFGGQFGIRYENAPKVTAPGQKFVEFNDGNVPSTTIFRCDLYSDACKFFGTVNSVGGYEVNGSALATNNLGDWTGSPASMLVPQTIYSHAGTQLAACASGYKGAEAVVSDATALTPGTAYSVTAGAGTDVVHVQCTLTGSTYAWQTM